MRETNPQPSPCDNAIMRRELILVAAAAVFGVVGGYAWSALNAPPPKTPPHAKAAFMPLPPSPEEQPSASDAQWTAEADDTNAAVATANAAANAESQP